MPPRSKATSKKKSVKSIKFERDDEWKPKGTKKHMSHGCAIRAAKPKTKTKRRSFKLVASDDTHVAELGIHDVLLGRGPKIISHPGNILFRLFVCLARQVYISVDRGMKSQVANLVVRQMQALDPPGRFVHCVEDIGEYFLVDPRKVLEKTGQALREHKMNPPECFQKLIRKIKATTSIKHKLKYLVDQTGICPAQLRVIQEEFTAIIENGNLVGVTYLGVGTDHSKQATRNADSAAEQSEACNTMRGAESKATKRLPERTESSDDEDTISDGDSDPSCERNDDSEHEQNDEFYAMNGITMMQVAKNFAPQLTVAADSDSITEDDRDATDNAENGSNLDVLVQAAVERSGQEPSKRKRSYAKRGGLSQKRRKKARTALYHRRKSSKKAQSEETVATPDDHVARELEATSGTIPVIRERKLPAKAPRFLNKPKSSTDAILGRSLSEHGKASQNMHSGVVKTNVADTLDESFASLPPQLTAFFSGMYSSGALCASSSALAGHVRPSDSPTSSPIRGSYEGDHLPLPPNLSSLLSGLHAAGTNASTNDPALMPPKFTSILSGFYGGSQQECLSAMAKCQESVPSSAFDGATIMPPALTSILSGIFSEKGGFKNPTESAGKSLDVLPPAFASRMSSSDFSAYCPDPCKMESYGSDFYLPSAKLFAAKFGRNMGNKLACNSETDQLVEGAEGTSEIVAGTGKANDLEDKKMAAKVEVTKVGLYDRPLPVSPATVVHKEFGVAVASKSRSLLDDDGDDDERLAAMNLFSHRKIW